MVLTSEDNKSGGNVSSGTIFWHHPCPTVTPDRICDESYDQEECETAEPGDRAP